MEFWPLPGVSDLTLCAIALIFPFHPTLLHTCTPAPRAFACIDMAEGGPAVNDHACTLHILMQMHAHALQASWRLGDHLEAGPELRVFCAVLFGFQEAVRAHVGDSEALLLQRLRHNAQVVEAGIVSHQRVWNDENLLLPTTVGIWFTPAASIRHV